MRAAIQTRFGQAHEVIEVAEVPMPVPKPGEVLVKVGAASVNALDWHYMVGTPLIARSTMGWRRPRRLIPGADIAGTVVATAGHSGSLAPGDEVFAEVGGGGFAEYVAVPEDRLVAKPSRLTLEEAATLGVAALTALQGLRDWGSLVPGQSVLINGGSGGVGTFAIQVARALGAGHITAVVSSRHLETAGRLGADRVVDYTVDDFSRSGEKFDLLYDNAGSWSLSASRNLLNPAGTMVMITGVKGRWIAPVPRLVAGKVRSLAGSKGFANGVASQNRADQETLRDMVERGAVSPVMDRRFSLDEAAEALAYQGEGHSKGKSVVIP